MTEKNPVNSSKIKLIGTNLIEPSTWTAPAYTNLIEVGGRIILLSPGGSGPKNERWVTHGSVPTEEDWALVDKRREELLRALSAQQNEVKNPVPSPANMPPRPKH